MEWEDFDIHDQSEHFEKTAKFIRPGVHLEQEDQEKYIPCAPKETKIQIQQPQTTTHWDGLRVSNRSDKIITYKQGEAKDLLSWEGLPVAIRSPCLNQNVQIDETQAEEGGSLTNRCRFCLSDQEVVSSLFNLHSGRSIAQQLLDLLCVRVVNSPNWPSFVCCNCVDTLAAVEAFRQMIFDSHQTLHVTIQSLIQEQGWTQDGDLLSQQKYTISEDEPKPQHGLEGDQEDEPEDLAEQDKEKLSSESFNDLNQSPEAEVIYGEPEQVPEEKHEDISMKTQERKVVKCPAATIPSSEIRINHKVKYTLAIPRSADEIGQLNSFLHNEGLLQCPQCPKNLTTIAFLEDHLKSVHEEDQLQILCCNSHHVGKVEILDHADFHVQPDKLKCYVCQEQHHYFGALFIHNRRAHRQSLFKCPNCDQMRRTLPMLKKHFTTHLAQTEKPQVCDHCPKRFNDNHAKKRHMERVHETDLKYQCSQCGKCFSSWANRWQHEKHHNKTKTSQATMKVSAGKNSRAEISTEEAERNLYTQCKVCRDWQLNILTHWRFKHRSEFVPDDDDLELKACYVCSKEMARFKMPQHVFTNHTRPPLLCSICGMKFQRYTNYEVHMDKHLNRKYPCPCCEKVNISSQGRVLHIKAHHPNYYKTKIRRERKSLY